MDIPCFLIEPTGRVAQSLIVYTYDSGEECGEGKDRYHRGEVALPIVEWPAGDRDYPDVRLDDETLTWPTRCDRCGVELPANIWRRSASSSRIFRNVTTGEEYSAAHRAPVGAMFRTPWLASVCRAPDGGDPLTVNTPGGHWTIDLCASGCEEARKPLAERLASGHRCWQWSGTPPLVTATPSIAINMSSPGGYHGWLTNGVLRDA